MKDCNHCKDVNQKYDIKSPAELKKAIKVIKDNLNDGTIIGSTYWPADIIHFNQQAFNDLNDDGPWDDVLSYYFECPACKQLFCLSAEIYHGSGGSWSPTEKQ